MTQNWSKRDTIVGYEKAHQKSWLENKSTLTPTNDTDKEKCFVTFPYPYMNGTLHLGHAYTISKAEFYSRYKQLCGVNVLFPFGFHGTGMPIVACAKKLKSELTTTLFDQLDSLEDSSQAKILIKMGVTKEDLPKFTDPYYWLTYFPQKAREDLTRFGISADFSRSFITTDMNPYYDSFIKWQFNKLNSSHKLIFGKKPVIYSILDNQPCADHDRSIGEGVGIKEFTLLKMQVFSTNTFLLVATTRPDTMDGLTNLWVNQDMKYSVFTCDNIKYICREETIRNLQYQLDKKFVKHSDIQGSDLLGLTVLFNNKPLKIYHMPTDPNMGSGIVASVPASCVIDYKNYMKLKESAIVDVIAIDNRPTSEYIATALAKKQSVADISKELYKLEQEFGLMITGKYATRKCSEVRNLIRDDMISQNMAWMYYEPEEKVISRSGDNCIVALTDQWFINYGDAKWKEETLKYCKDTLNTYNPQVKSLMLSKIDWLNEYPFSRSCGLGTKLLDTDYVIDSLSDSTIYMAYYTVAHKIEKLPKELLCDELWDCLFLGKTLGKNLPKEQLNKYSDLLGELQTEFKYWYPVDLRVSGKDLIGNHLPMTLYNHINIWPSHMCPRNYSVNGHLLINNKKMSKHTGNFLTLRDAVDKFGADATRIALAEAGSSLDDANFEEINAQNAILKLTIELEWCTNMIKFVTTNTSPTTDQKYTLWDSIFENEIKMCAIKTKKHYDELDFQKVIVSGFYDLMIARDKYRNKVEHKLISLNASIIKLYLEVHMALLYPICPHYVSQLQATGHKFPTFTDKDVDMKYIWIRDGIDEYLSRCRNSVNTYKKKHKDQTTYKLSITVCSNGPEIIKIITDVSNTFKTTSNGDRKVVIEHHTKNDTDSKEQKSKKIKFINYIINEIVAFGDHWVKWIQLDDEFELITEWLPKLLTDMKSVTFEFSRQTNNSNLMSGCWNPKITCK